MNYFLEDPTIGKAAQLKKMETTLTGKTVDPLPSAPVAPVEDITQEFKKLSLAQRSQLTKDAIEGSDGNLLIPSVQDPALKKFNKLKISRGEADSIPLYGESTLSKPTGTEVPLSQYRPDDGSNMFGELWKGLQKGVVNVVESGAGTVEMLANRGLPGNEAYSGAKSLKYMMQNYIAERPELNPTKNAPTKLSEGWNNPEYLAYNIGNLVPNIAGAIAAGVAAGPAGTYGFAFSQEAGNTYNELEEMGIPEWQRAAASTLYGSVAAVLESIMPGGVASKIVTPKNVMKLGMKQAAVDFVKTLPKKTLNILRAGATEGMTETIQQLSQNFTKYYFDRNQDILEGVPESAFFGAIGGAGMDVVGDAFSGTVAPVDTLAPGSFQENEAEQPGNTPPPSGPTSNVGEIYRLSEQKKSLETALTMANKLAEEHPDVASYAGLVEDARRQLDEVSSVYGNALNVFLQNNKFNEIQNENLDISTAQLDDNQWVAEGKAMVQGMSFQIPFSESVIAPTAEDASAQVAAKIQGWLETQMQNQNVSDVGGLARIDESLQELLSRPSVTSVMDNQDLAREAQDMSEAEFLTKFAGQGEINALKGLYKKSQDIRVQETLKQEAEKPIRQLADDLGVDVQWVEHIATVEGRRALGSFKGQTIQLLQDKKGNPIADKDTAWHELGHAYFRTVMTPESRSSVLNQVKSQHNLEKDIDAEERLVEDLKDYVAKKEKDTSTYGKFLGNLLQQVKKFVNWVRGDKVSQFYEDLLSKKRPKERQAFTQAEQEDRMKQEAERKTVLENKVFAEMGKDGVAVDMFLGDEVLRLEGDKKNLVVLHNTNLDNLRKSVALDGLPVPSLAITRTDIPFTEFGSITLVGNKNMVDQSVDARNKIFSADAYTPRVPEELTSVDIAKSSSILNEIKANAPESIKDDVWISRIREALLANTATIESLQNDLWNSPVFLNEYLNINKVPHEFEYSPSLLDSPGLNLQQLIAENPALLKSPSVEDLQVGSAYREQFIQALSKYINSIKLEGLQNLIRSKYINEDGSLSFSEVDSIIYGVNKELKTRGSKVDMRTTVSKFQELIDEVLFKEWIASKFQDVFGDKYFLKGKRKVLYTLRDLVDAMSGKTKAQESSLFGSDFGTLRGKLSRSVTVEQVQKNRGSFLSKDNGEAIYEKIKDQYAELGDTLKYKYERADFFAIMQSLFDAVVLYSKKSKTAESMKKALEQNDFIIDNNEHVLVKEIADAIMSLPSSYMEAKPQRAVMFDEFDAIVVPEEEVGAVRQLLSGYDLAKDVYGYRDDNQRQEIIDNIASTKDIAFRLEHDTFDELDAMRVDVTSKMLSKALVKDININTVEDFTNLVSYAYNLDTELASKYGIGLPESILTQLEDLTNKVQQDVGERMVDLELHINPETSNKPLIASTARMLAKEIYPILERSTKKRRDLVTLDYPSMEKRLSEYRNSQLLSDDEIRSIDNFSSLQNSIMDTHPYIESGTDEAQTFFDDLIDSAIQESVEYIGQGQPEMARLAREYKGLARTQKKVDKYIGVTKKQMETVRNDFQKKQIQLQEHKESMKFRRIGRNLAEVAAMDALPEKGMSGELKKVTKKAARETREKIRAEIAMKRQRENLLNSINKLRKSVRSAAQKGDKMSLARTKELLSLFDAIEQSALSPNTLIKLDDIREMVRNDAMIAEDVREWYDKTLERIGKVALSEMNNEQLQELYSTLAQIAELGKLELEMQRFQDESEKQVAVDYAIQSTINIDGKVEAGPATAKNSSNRAKKAANKLSMYDYMGPIHMLDRFDGDKMYDGVNVSMGKELQTAEQLHHKDLSNVMEELTTRVREIKNEYTDNEQAYITLIARMREGAKTQAESIMQEYGWDEVPNEVEGVTLDMAESVVDIIQDVNAKYGITERLASTFEARENKPFHRVKNYVVSAKYDRTMRDFEEQIDVAQTGGRHTSEVPQGFTVSRKPSVTLRPRTDIFALAYETFNSSLWYINMQPAIDNVQQVVSSKEYMQHAGDVVSQYWKEYLQIVAQRGSRGAYHFPWLVSLKNNITKAILGFKASTVLLQPTAGLNAIMTANMMYGADVAMEITKELGKAFVTPSYKKDSLSQSDALMLRSGMAGTVDMYELKQLAQRGFFDEKTTWEKFSEGYAEMSMSAIQEFDIRTAGAVRNGVYNALIKNGVPPEKASADADFFMNLTQSSNQVTDRPLALAKGGDVTRLLLVFQTYSMGLFSLVKQGIWRSGVRNGLPAVKIKALMALASIPIFNAVAQELVRMINLMIKGETDDESLEEKLNNVMKSAPFELVGLVPFVGSIIKGGFQYNRGYSNPVFDIPTDLIAGGKLLTSDSQMKQLKGASLTAEALATALGIPGTMQAFDVINSYIKDDADKKKSVLQYYAKRVNNGETTDSTFRAALRELNPKDEKQVNELHDTFLKQVILTGSNLPAKIVVKEQKIADKVSVLAGYHKTMSQNEFRSLISYLRQYKEFSEETEEQLAKQLSK